MIKAIIFDCFGVLATDIWLAFCDGLPPEADIKRARDLNKAFDRGMITEQEFFNGVEQATGQRPPDLDKVGIVKNTALLAYVSELSKQYKIGILSNISSDWIMHDLLTAEEQALFSDMVFSYQVGMVKPDPGLYELACERLGVRPEEAVMIDDREGYITAAREVGMEGVIYGDLQQTRAELRRILTHSA